MSSHRLDRPSAQRPGRRRAAPVRPRYGRIGSALAAGAITGVALLGGVGVLGPPQDAGERQGTITTQVAEADWTAQMAWSSSPFLGPTDGAVSSASATTSSTESSTEDADAEDPALTPPAAAPLPADSGSGRRVVFAIDSQRVWLVDKAGVVLRSYLVSGSLTDNLKPGSYTVYSRSRWAVGIDDSGTMEYFVRFTRGENAPIGFHSIPHQDGRPLQTVAELGTPQSHGCIRQRKSDAQRLWRFASDGTRVVVTA